MHPEIDLRDFKATAVIDWLDIAVTLGHTTQFQYVQAELHSLLGLSPSEALIHVTAQNVTKATDAATGFVFRLQEHHHENNAAKIAYIVRGLEAFFGFTAPARITGIEAAFDLKPRRNPKVVYEAYAVLHDRIAAYGMHARQYTYSVRRKRGQLVPLTLDPVFDPDGTLYVGHQDDEHGYQPTAKAYRAYAKVTDNGKPLPPDQHRARVEVTLQLEALEEYGLTDPLALASYDFTRLARLLHFQPLKPIEAIVQASRDELKKDLLAAISACKTTRKPTRPEELEQLRRRVRYSPVKAAALASIYRNTDRMIDWHRGWEGSEGRPLQHSKDTEPDARLNRKVKAALQTLSKNMTEGIYSPASPKRAKAL
ncbi:hypothetical protein [Comamonas testosteroni]|uniref:hypothetical protein n=1 Tax=Comamonas testosteroni TaxID=285 RepID=UPI0002DA592D|nr:hypothetical protein [Comamonas testosteroni]